MKFKLLTDMYHTLNKGDIIEVYDVKTTKERIKGVLHKYPAGYRIVNNVRIPWVCPPRFFELVKESK